jgi:hypothetical protein
MATIAFGTADGGYADALEQDDILPTSGLWRAPASMQGMLEAR